MSYSISRRAVRCLALLTGLLSPTFTAVAQTVVTFPDANLEQVVLEALEKEPGDAILDTDMAALIPPWEHRQIQHIHTNKGKGAAPSLLTVAELGLSSDELARLKGTEVQFEDTELENLVRGTLDIPDGPVTAADMARLTILRDESHVDIVDLTGLEYAVNLVELDLSYNEIKDLTPLAKLIKLSILELIYNEIEDIGPLTNLDQLRILTLESNSVNDLTSLSSLLRLEALNLKWNLVEQVEPLHDLVALKSLLLSYNSIEDVEPLSNLDLERLELATQYIDDIGFLRSMTGLQYLDLTGNRIVDITPLTNLRDLKTLGLRHNLIRNIAALAGLTNLEELALGFNEIAEIRPLSELRELRTLDLRDNMISDASVIGYFSNLEDLYFRSNQLHDIEFLSNLTNLKALDLGSNKIEDIVPLREIPSLFFIHLGDNRIRDIAPLASLDNLTGLILRDNEIADFSPIFDKLEIDLGNMIDIDRNPVDFFSMCDFLTDLYERDVINAGGWFDLGCLHPNDDYDDDGLTNRVESQFGSDAWLADTDSDGFSDEAEFLAGTYPYNADSVPVERSSEASLQDIAEVLLAGLTSVSENGYQNKTRYVFSTCKLLFPGISYRQFEVLDANKSKTLSALELEAVLSPFYGCSLTTDGTKQTFHENKSDITVLGIALLGLLFMKRQ